LKFEVGSGEVFVGDLPANPSHNTNKGGFEVANPSHNTNKGQFKALA
jgi:hypothetical protein